MFYQNKCAEPIFIFSSCFYFDCRDKGAIALVMSAAIVQRIFLFRDGTSLPADECIGFDLIGTIPAWALVFFMPPALNSVSWTVSVCYGGIGANLSVIFTVFEIIPSRPA